MSAKVTIIDIIRNFWIVPVAPAHVPILGNEAVLTSKNGLIVKLVSKK